MPSHHARARRPFALLAATVLTAAGLAVVGPTGPATADPTDPVPACTTGGPRPCVVSFTQNGLDPEPGFGYDAVLTSAGQVNVSVSKDGGADLGFGALGDTFSVTLDMGSLRPSILDGHARDATVTRTHLPSGYRLTVAASPVTLSGQCDQSTSTWVCPEADVTTSTDFNNIQWDGYLDFWVDDASYISDPAIRSSLYGLDYFTNIAAGSLPPRIEDDPATGAQYLKLELANRRFLEDGTTLVRGHAELRIPNAFLKQAYGVPDPASMNGSSLTVSGPEAGALVSVTQESGDDAMRVLVDRLSFPDVHAADGVYRGAQARPGSRKVLKVRRGVITPRKVTLTSAQRLGPRKARLVSTRAKARGAKVRGYQARCTSGRTTVKVTSKVRTLTVTGLEGGRSYRCQVRPLSKAGPGRWSGARRV